MGSDYRVTNRKKNVGFEHDREVISGQICANIKKNVLAMRGGCFVGERC